MFRLTLMVRFLLKWQEWKTNTVKFTTTWQVVGANFPLTKADDRAESGLDEHAAGQIS